MPFDNIGPLELIIVLVIALVVIGPKRLPDVGKSLGKGIREFKDSLSGVTDDTKRPARAKISEPDDDTAVASDAAPSSHEATAVPAGD